MEVKELIKKQPSEVRNSNELMMAYINAFTEILGYKPDCAGCTFHNDWNNFVLRVKNTNVKFKNNIMPNKNFQVRDNTKIYTYRVEGQSVARCYGSDMTEEFALAYLENGTEEEIEQRKKEFKVLPIANAVDENEYSKDEIAVPEIDFRKEVEETPKVLPIANAVVNKNTRGNSLK